MKLLTIILTTLSASPEFVFSNKTKEETTFPVKPVKGFYLRLFTLFSPMQNAFLSALDYAVGSSNILTGSIADLDFLIQGNVMNVHQIAIRVYNGH